MDELEKRMSKKEENEKEVKEERAVGWNKAYLIEAY